MLLEEILFFIYQTIFFFLPFAGLIFLGWLAFKMWVHYVRQDFISGIEFVVLEVIPPRDVERSPRAMELFFTNALYHWSNKGDAEKYWQGAVWFWFSLEIASIEGQVHFYIRTPSRLKGLIETQMYAQYPQAQIKEVDDYTLAVDPALITENGPWKAWACEFGLEKPEAFPIKTYADFGLDDDPKEEFKIDPISPIIELFGALQKGEQAWLQIVITPPTMRLYKTHGTWFGKHDWVEEAHLQIKRLLAPYSSTRQSADDPHHFGTEVRVPKFLDDTVEAMTKKITKLGFETGIRLVYLAKREAFQLNNRRNVRLIMRQFSNPNSNAFKRINSAQPDAYATNLITDFFPLSQKRVAQLQSRLVHEYQERSFYHLPLRHHILTEAWLKWPLSRIFLPYKHHQTYILNVEELATLWHFPGQVLKVPTLERIESKEASPPTNLPI